jgi:ATPase involved in conjugal plasmid transfer
VIQDLAYGMTDVLSAKYFCDLIGVSTVETTSIKKSNSIEGDIEEYGQKSISTQKRNLLNIDEILRIPSTKLIVNLRGNKPLLLDKVIYTEHPLSKKLTDNPVSDYKPNWTKNTPDKVPVKEKTKEKPQKKQKIGWDNF